METKQYENNNNHETGTLSVDIQYAHEHYPECVDMWLLKNYNLPQICTFKEFAAMPPKTKKIIMNLIYNNVIITYTNRHSGKFAPSSKIKVIAKNGKTAVWCFAIRMSCKNRAEYRIFDCSSPIWDREVNQW